MHRNSNDVLYLFPSLLFLWQWIPSHIFYFFLVQFTNDPLAVPFYGGYDSVMCASAAVT
jgi:hypothetical protein